MFTDFLIKGKKATQPCPCGYLGDGTDRCVCSANKVERYRAKLSGPMLDRIDMHIHLPRISTSELRRKSASIEPSSVVRARVNKVRSVQLRRQGQLNFKLSGIELEQYCSLDDGLHQFLDSAAERLHLSARAYHRILRLACTIADAQEREGVEQRDLAEAISYRSLDRRT